MLMPVDPSSFCGAARPEDPRIGNIATRMKSVAEVSRDSVVIIGIPDDRGVVAGHGRAGAAHGPSSFRECFYRLPLGPNGELARLKILDAGDVMVVGEQTSTHERLAKVVADIARKGCTTCLIGGGHDATYGSVSGLKRAWKKFGLINIDAHLDCRPAEPSSAINSGTAFRRLLEDGVVKGEQLAEFGIQRHTVAKAHWSYASSIGVRLWEWEALQGVGASIVFDGLVSDMSRRYGRVAVSFDLDAIAAADAPGVSAPAPLGFSSVEAIRFVEIAGVAQAVRHMEFMELNPVVDVGGRTSRLAALLLWRFCAVKGGSL